MKKSIFGALATLLLIPSAAAQITISFKQHPAFESKIEVTHIAISDFRKSREERKKLIVVDTLSVTSPNLSFNVASTSSQYTVDLGSGNVIGFFAAPGEKIAIDVNSIEPLSYTLSGTELVEGIQTINDKIFPIRERIMKLRSQENVDRDLINSQYESYKKAFTDFIAENPESTAVPYAMLNLDPEEMTKAWSSLSNKARMSIVMPLAQVQYEQAMERLGKQRKLDTFQSGDVDAPTFILKDLNGKDVSLADYRGKWVILDFWGTWCPWCIKGFQALKDAYSKYDGKIEIIGIDCGDTEEQWRAGVKQFELPWVQVYKPEAESKIISDYYVQSFPTKIIISPEGKVANITVGENPEFFTTLARLIEE